MFGHDYPPGPDVWGTVWVVVSMTAALQGGRRRTGEEGTLQSVSPSPSHVSPFSPVPKTTMRRPAAKVNGSFFSRSPPRLVIYLPVYLLLAATSQSSYVCVCVCTVNVRAAWRQRRRLKWLITESPRHHQHLTENNTEHSGSFCFHSGPVQSPGQTLFGWRWCVIGLLQCWLSSKVMETTPTHPDTVVFLPVDIKHRLYLCLHAI